MSKKIRREMAECQVRSQRNLNRLIALRKVVEADRAEAADRVDAAKVAELDQLIHDLDGKIGEVRYRGTV